MAISLKPTKKSKEAQEMDAAIDGAVAEATERKEKKPRNKKIGRKTEQYYLDKYPHAVAGSLQFDPEANKQSMELKCQVCGATRRVYTSDLFQIKTCLECSKKVKAAKRGKVKEGETAPVAEAPAQA